MDLKDFSKSELVSVLELIEKARKCSSLEDVRGLVLDTKDLVEADFAICGLGSVKGTEITGPVNIVNGNYPAEWEKGYLKNKLYFKDPIVEYHTRYSTSCLWRDMHRETDDIATNEALAFAFDFNIRFGISTSIYIPEYSSISIFAFSGSRDSFTGHQKKLTDLLSLHLNRALAKTTYDRPTVENNVSDDITTLKDRLIPFTGGSNGL